MLLTGKTIPQLDYLPNPAASDLVAIADSTGKTWNTQKGSSGIVVKGIFRNDAHAAQAVDEDGQALCNVGDWYELSQSNTVGGVPGTPKKRLV